VFVIVCVSGSSSAHGCERWKVWVSLTPRMTNKRTSAHVRVPFGSRHGSERPRRRCHPRLVWFSHLYPTPFRSDDYPYRCAFFADKTN
jgi:hypothetical protein